MTESSNLKGFEKLFPDTIINAIESLDYIPDKRILLLNSFENRVYRVGIENESPIIAKFYRENRWTNETIQEEHQFTLELKNSDIPVIAPLVINNNTLFEFENYRFSIYPCFGGYAPELDNSEHLMQLGLILAQLHNIGDMNTFNKRQKLTIQTYAKEPAEYLLENNFIPPDLENAYSTLINDIIKRITNSFEKAGDFKTLRIHGDCHNGNMLTRDKKFFFLDFDDACSGPAIQDIWMFLSGDRNYMTARLNDFMDGYVKFRKFDACELHMIEALRTIRIIHYAGWLAQRWNDPAFPIAFPFFNTQQYWQDQILSLREQAALMDEPPLILK